MILKRGLLFHFALGLANDIAGPACTKKIHKIRMYIFHVWPGAFHLIGIQNGFVEFSISKVL